MKNLTKFLFVLSLFSVSAAAQTKPKIEKTPAKTASKSSAAKPAPKPSAKNTEKNTAKTPQKSAVKDSAKTPQKTTAKNAVKTPVKAAAKTSEKTPEKNIPAAPAKSVAKPAAKSAVDKGEIAWKTYTNKTFNFAITLPETWLIPGDDFEEFVKKQGFDLSLEAPKAASEIVQSRLDQAASRVHLLLTAYKMMPGSNENAILRVSVEDLKPLPQIKDAVDYFDLMRETFKAVKLPPDFKYSETQAERLGKMQFGYLDTSNSAGKKRMYATVRNGYAVMFTLTYNNAEDLETMKTVLAKGNFRLQ
jgi:hypothetical protein